MNETSIADELEAALIGTPLDRNTPIAEQDLVYDGDQATRWGAELHQVNRKRAEVVDAFDAAVDRMRKVVDERLQNLDDHAAELEEVLCIYHEVRLAEDPDGCKTIVLPTVTLKSRMGTAKWEIDDLDAYGSWIVENLPGAVEIPEPKVKYGEAKKLLKSARISDGKVCLSDGTVVPGVTVIPPERSFSVVDPG